VAKRNFMIAMISIKFRIKFMKFGKDRSQRMTQLAKKTLSFASSGIKREA